MHLLNRPLMIDRQIEDRGRADESFAPVHQLIFERAALQALALPIGEIDVLDGQFGQRGVHAVDQPPIEDL